MFRTILTLFLAITIAGLKAQGLGELLSKNKEENLIVKTWSVSDGLVSNSVRKIGKTKSGFLFVTTYNGISFFDGKNFENFDTEDISSHIYDFCVDKDSIFWIATYRGVIAFDGQEFFVPDKFKELENHNIQTISIDKEGTLWIGTISDGLYYFKDKKLKKVTEIKDFNKSIVSLLFPDKVGNMWIGTEQGNLYKYDGERFEILLEAKINNGILSAIQDNNGNYYFGTRNGLFTYENDSILLVNSELTFINDFKLDKNGQLWIAAHSGLYYYNTNSKQFFSVFSKLGVSRQIIQTIYFDSEDIIWIGTYRKGLMQLRVGAFQNAPLFPYNIDEIPSALAEINDSTLWVGTDEGKVFELIDGRYSRVNFKTELNNGRIKSIFVDSKNTKWVCSYNGLLKIKNGHERLLNTSTGFTDNTIRGIVENADGSYWLATRQSGLYQITENFEILKNFNINNGLSSNFIMAIVKGKNDRLFVATKTGLDIIEEGKVIKHYGKKNGLIEEMVFNVYEDEKGVIWVATIGGLTMINGEKTTSFSKQNGLIDEIIFDILEDNEGFMWLPAINGIIRVDKSELIEYADGNRNSIFSVIFDKSDGIFDQQYVNATRALRLHNGNIAFNTISAISTLNPKIASSVKSKQSLFIKGITTESQTYLNNKGLATLPSSSKYLQIDYSYIDFINPDKVEFNYKLEPFDSDWQLNGSERVAKYTNLPPGDYVFTLKAIVKSKGGKELRETIQFTIQPAFYENTWFRIIAVIIIILFVWFIYVLRVRTIKHQKELLENEVAERTAEISEQKTAIEKNIEELELQKSEIADKNEEIVIARNKIEQAYINLKLLSDLGKEITSSLAVEEIVMTVYHNLSGIMDNDLVAIGNFNKKRNTVNFKSSIYKGKKQSAFEIEMSPLECIICYSIENEMSIISNDFEHDYPAFEQSFPNIKLVEPFSSVIVLPIRSNDGIIGVLTTQSFRKNSYSDYHFNLMRNLVVYVGIAIENTKTYQKMQLQKDELQKVNAAKDKMFSIIGHDLRSPVGTIKSFLDIIIENPEMTNDENALHIFKTMQQSLGSAYSLLDNLLLWAKNQRGQIDYEPNDFNIIEPIKESINLVVESAKNKEISIEKEVNRDTRVFADKNMITTVLRNLISNAIKFTNKKGQIKVVATIQKIELNGKLNELVEIKVIDNGIGISKDNINKILKTNELFTTPGTLKEQGSGLGIGICIDFLKKHNQNLHVENNMEIDNTKGTTFKFYLTPGSKSKKKQN